VARLGDARAGAVLAAAMESGAMPAVGRSGMPGERRARILARLEETLSPEDLVEARAQGSAMSYDEVVEFLLERIAARRAALATEAPRD
jgi:hypothetical protein